MIDGNVVKFPVLDLVAFAIIIWGEQRDGCNLSTPRARAGIEDFRFHDLRHTFASHFIMRGGDLLTLKEILGHSSLKMVQRYTHLAAAHKTRQVNNLSGIYTNCHLFATSQKPPPKLIAAGK